MILMFFRFEKMFFGSSRNIHNLQKRSQPRPLPTSGFGSTGGSGGLGLGSLAKLMDEKGRMTRLNISGIIINPQGMIFVHDE